MTAEPLVTEKKGVDKSMSIPEDAYSLIFVSPIQSMAHMAALLVFVIQMSVLFFFLQNKLFGNSSNSKASFNESINLIFGDDNFLKIPLYVFPVVSACQVLALFIVWLDNLHALSRFAYLFNGYPTFELSSKDDDEVFGDHPDDLPPWTNGSHMKYLFSHTLRMCVSSMVMLVSLLIIVQSDNVINLFLDFVAVTFVGTLDKTLYVLTKHGVFCGAVKNYVTLVEKMTVHRTMERRCICLKNIVLGMTLLGLASLFAWAKWYQSHDLFHKYKCHSFKLNIQAESSAADGLVKFNFFTKVLPNINNAVRNDINDESWQTGKTMEKPLDYRNFNGLYTPPFGSDGFIDTSAFTDHRATYYQEGRSNNIDLHPVGQITYCMESRRWVFQIPGITKGEEEDKKGCDWLMRSTQTTAYTLDDISKDGWEIWSGPFTGLIQPMKDNTFLSCTNCEDDTTCNYHGKCQNSPGLKKACTCKEPWTGAKCDVCAACDNITFSIHDGGFDVTMIKTDNVEVYGRAVYEEQEYVHDNTTESHALLVYTGGKFVYGSFSTTKESHCDDRAILHGSQCEKSGCCEYDADRKTCKPGIFANICDLGETSLESFLSNYHSAWTSPSFFEIVKSGETEAGYPESDLSWKLVFNDTEYDNDADYDDYGYYSDEDDVDKANIFNIKVTCNKNDRCLPDES